jgi:glutamate racemase
MVSRKQKSIGVFDSGIGGLTVVRALMSRLPNENITYFGDTARVPYGNKSAEVVRTYAIEDTQFLISQHVKVIVVACNTASAVAIDALRHHFDIPIIGMINPGAVRATEVTRNGRIGVIGTLATVASQSYQKEILGRNKALSVVSKACPLFVPLAEEGWSEHRISQMVADEYLAPLRKESIDTLILGCTHYPILRTVIQRAVGHDVLLVDSGEAAAGEVAEVLASTGLMNESTALPNYSFFVSDVPQRFRELGTIFLGTPQMRVTKVHIP